MRNSSDPIFLPLRLLLQRNDLDVGLIFSIGLKVRLVAAIFIDGFHAGDYKISAQGQKEFA